MFGFFAAIDFPFACVCRIFATQFAYRTRYGLDAGWFAGQWLRFAINRDHRKTEASSSA